MSRRFGLVFLFAYVVPKMGLIGERVFYGTLLN